MLDLEITVDDSKARRKLFSFEKVTDRIIREELDLLGQRLAGVFKGSLPDSLSGKIVYEIKNRFGSYELKIRNRDPRASWLIPYLKDGTKPHTISAARGGGLAFPGKDGGGIVRKTVQHPGTKPNAALQSALKFRAPLAVKAFASILRAKIAKEASKTR